MCCILTTFIAVFIRLSLILKKGNANHCYLYSSYLVFSVKYLIYFSLLSITLLMKLLLDFFPIFLFFIVYKFYGDLPAIFITSTNALLPFMDLTIGESKDAIYLATLVAIIATFFQVALSAIINKKVEKMHLVTLGLFIVFGGATLFLKDPLFIKWKPTAINWLFGLAFLGSQFIGEKPLVQRMMAQAVELSSPLIWRKLNLAWVGFFAISGLSNIYVAFNYPEETWVNFKLFGLLGLTIVFIIGQAVFLSKYIVTEEEDDNHAV